MVRDLAERLSLKLFNLVRREPAFAVGEATPLSMVRPWLDSMELFHSSDVCMDQDTSPKASCVKIKERMPMAEIRFFFHGDGEVEEKDVRG